MCKTRGGSKGSGDVVLAGLFGNLYAGWGYNGAYAAMVGDPPLFTLLTSAEAIKLSKDALRNEPFFQRFEQEDNLFNFNGDNMYGVDQDATADKEAAKAGTQYKLLAEAIPSRSFAAAANKIDEFKDYGYMNFDMMDYRNQGLWPEGRLFAPRGGDWWHSDFKAVAMLYTYPMWQKMIDTGVLTE